MKKCTKCGQELSAIKEYFYADKQKKDGLCSHCKQCNSGIGFLKDNPETLEKAKEYLGYDGS